MNKLCDDPKVLWAEQRVNHLLRSPLVEDDSTKRPPPRRTFTVSVLSVRRLASVDVTLKNLQYRHVVSSQQGVVGLVQQTVYVVVEDEW